MAHVTFVHGIGNKPEQKALLQSWLDALANAASPLNLSAEGISHEMVYWADVLYAAPATQDSMESGALGIEGTAEAGAPPPLPEAGERTEAMWLAAMMQRLGIDPASTESAAITASPPGTMAHDFERFPLPWFIKEAFLRRFLRDGHHYLFDTSHSPRPGVTHRVQQEIRRRYVEKLRVGEAKSRPHIVVSHSMGTVIAYDCLKRVPECPSIDALVTIGSPLGIDEIQDRLQPGWTRDDGFPTERVASGWLNFFDKHDVVARLDPYLANDYRRDSAMAVEDTVQPNDGEWRHDIVKYLGGRQTSRAIGRLLGVST